MYKEQRTRKISITLNGKTIDTKLTQMLGYYDKALKAMIIPCFMEQEQTLLKQMER